MKLKGVSFFEQNVEKIVLGTVSAVFLGVVALQFLYEPNQIKVGSGQPVAPGRAFDPVKVKVDEIARKLDAPKDSLGLPEIPNVDLVRDFQARRLKPVAPADTIIALGKGVNVEGESAGAEVRVQGQQLVKLVVPATSVPVACGYRNTFDPTESLSHPELAKLLPKEQPMDKASVSVQANFDGTALKAALMAPATGGASPYPPQWWRDQIEIVGVKLERQEQVSNGSWANPVEVPLPPGRGFPDLTKGARVAADIGDIASTARASAENILRPEFYRTIAGTSWKEPVEAINSNDPAKGAEIRKLVQQRADLTKEKGIIEKQLEAVVNPPPPRGPTGPGPGGGGGGKGGGGGDGGGGGGGGRQPTTDPEKEKIKKEQRERPFRDRLKKNEDLLAKNESDLKALGMDTDGNPLPAAPAAAVQVASKPVLDNNAVKLWAHDLTVEPGKTYRYRVSVVVLNPAFGRGASLHADQQDLARLPVIVGEPSAWSEPVSVLADKYYYIVSATESDSQGPSRARAELFQFFYGYYRSCTVYLEPGDVLAGTVKLPDDKAKLPIYDLTKLAAAEPGQEGQAPVVPGQPVIPPSLRDQPQGPGGRGRVIDEGGRGAAPAPAAPADQVKVPLPANAKAWEGSVRVAFDSFFLDVAKTPGDNKAQAFLRSETGGIVNRGVVEDEKAETYRVLMASAKDGELQGQPLPPAPEKKKPDTETPPGRVRAPIPPTGPGGGGGGGG